MSSICLLNEGVNVLDVTEYRLHYGIKTMIKCLWGTKSVARLSVQLHLLLLWYMLPPPPTHLLYPYGDSLLQKAQII